MPVYQGLAFLLVLSTVVFVHEMGHFLAARHCGVRILAFSIGFGRELFGWTDRHGTRWKFCLVPLGGYVKMLGDADETSGKADITALKAESDMRHAFPTQPVWSRIYIAAAGPLANMIFAIVVYAGVFLLVGQPSTLPTVGKVMEGSAAEAAGIMPGDRFLRIDGKTVSRFEDVRSMTQLSLDRAMDVTLDRFGQEVTLRVSPRIVERKDRFGSVERSAVMGVVSSGETVLQRQGPVSATISAVKVTTGIIRDTFVAIGQMIRGVRSADELGGPIRIAEVSAQAAEAGLLPLIVMMAFLSVNLGLINILPIPLLDGGHLLFYAFEVVRGRPLSERVQDVGLKIGIGLVGGLMIFATWNDISRHIHRLLS